MIRTGQVEKVKKEMKASLRLTAESRQSGEAEALSLKQQGDTQDALKMMSRHRNELLKARRTLEQALDRRRDSQTRLERLQQVKELLGTDGGLLKSSSGEIPAIS
eukprot:g1820.t2